MDPTGYLLLLGKLEWSRFLGQLCLSQLERAGWSPSCRRATFELNGKVSHLFDDLLLCISVACSQFISSQKFPPKHIPHRDGCEPGVEYRVVAPTI
jgi:hypothetical protein